MTSPDENKQAPKGRKGKPSVQAGKKARGEPEWAEGLRQLYDSVVDEPLPESFKDLLSKLDDSKA